VHACQVWHYLGTGTTKEEKEAMTPKSITEVDKDFCKYFETCAGHSYRDFLNNVGVYYEVMPKEAYAEGYYAGWRAFGKQFKELMEKANCATTSE
jgi:hypothetical protein